MSQDTAEGAFSKQANKFDKIYSKSIITNYKRNRIRSLLLPQLEPNSTILELNGGTGEDALFFAKQGHYVDSTDISHGMLSEMKMKIEREKLTDKIHPFQVDYHNLDRFKGKKYDLIFSNFGGLNCTNELDKILKQLPDLLNSKGKICLVIMPTISIWELVSALKGNFNLAFRRFKPKGTPSHIEGQHFLSWYYNPSYIKKHLKTHFKIVALEALCLCVPPVHYENHLVNRPRIFKLLKSFENRFKSAPFLRGMGDYFIILLERKK